MSDDTDQWKQTAGLAADSTVAQIVCKEPDKAEWDEDAEEKGYYENKHDVVNEFGRKKQAPAVATERSIPTVGR